MVLTMAATPASDWFLKEWAACRGKIQADLVGDLGFHKNAAFRIWHGKQPYRRDLVNRIAAWLQIEPYELLMPPEEAVGLRHLRETALAIATSHTGPRVP